MKVREYLFLFLLIPFNTILQAQDLSAITGENKFDIRGQLGASLVFYNVEGREANRPAFSWMLVGNPVITVYGITFPFSFTVSEQERSFQQPFNRFGVSPSYKWAKLHLGYRNVSFSKYTLGGHTILGAGGEFTPGKFRIGVMYGQLLRPVPFNSYIQPVQTQQVPAYRRNGMAFRFGYGTVSNSADIIIFRASDVSGSIADTSQLLLPGSNTVVSFITHQKLLKDFVFDLELANSIYTEDNRLDGEPGMKLIPVISNLIGTNISTTSSNAIDASFGYDSKVFDLKVRLRQIDPGFQSMGTYFMQNNIRNITIEPSLSLSGDKYIIAGSLGFQRDNLKESLAHQTNRTIGSVRVAANPVKWYRADINYSNYDIDQKAGLNPLDPLSTINQISQTTSSINLVQNLSFAGKSLSQNIMVTLNNQLMTDHVNATGSSYRTFVAMGSYVIGYMPLRINLALNYSYSTFDIPTAVNTFHGPSASLSSSLMKGRLSLAVAGSRLSNILDNNLSGHITSGSFSTTFKITKMHMVRARLYVNNSTGTNSFTETKGELGYGFIF